MQFDFAALDTATGYKLLTATVTPRPIAWVTTSSVEGVVNAAPFSFFNVVGSAPPTVVLGLQGDPVKGFKDTARNIMATGEFVVNLVPESLAEAMNITAIDAPTGINELDIAGLEPAPSIKVTPPRIARSPVALECTMHSSIVTGPHQTLVVGRVVSMFIDDAYVIDAARGHVDNTALALVARSFGSEYIRTRDRFAMDRPTWAGWHNQTPPKA
ncbi:flavin reductase family protein [Pararhodobacter sp.]|uniref:flavin reductase family protein n=1 Tax=Pararhodobacter sp. TaxID=2127056 RepID=UPI002AFEDF3B|nr:flavin reductase family protein [Pararhodobacter sp.]